MLYFDLKQGVLFMKLYKNILIIILVIVLLATALVLVNKLPDNEEVPKQEETQKTEYIDVFRTKADDIINISIVTQKSSYTVSKNGNELLLSDSSNIKINNQALSSLLNACSYVYAEKIVTEKEDDLSIYGFSAPLATITVSLKDGSSKVLQVGNKTIDSSGNYIKMSGEDKIYIKSSYGISSLIPEYESFVDKNVLSINPKEYETLSSVCIEKQGNKAIKLNGVTEQNGEEKNTFWRMVKPVFADANTMVLTNDILTPLESFVADGVVEAKTNDLAKYGLDTPYAVFTVSAQGITQKFTFGKENNGYRYFKVDNFNTVYVASIQKISFIDVSYIDLMSRLVHTENVKNISDVLISSPDKNFAFKILQGEYFINDKKIDKNNFTEAYRNLISISLDSVDENAKKVTAPEITITYTRNDKSKCTVSFVNYDDRNYLALVDGKGNAIVNKKNVKDVLKLIQQKYDEAK